MKIPILFLLIIFLEGLSCSQVHKVDTRPNIVYILCDDLGYGDANVMAPEYCAFPTPHIDHLASKGMRFTNAHSGSSVCTPTRYGLLTGRYSWRTWLQKGVVQANADPLIAEGRTTVADLLKKQGYHTGIVGKWHLNYYYHDPQTNLRITPEKINKSAGVPIGTLIPDGPLSRGFDYFFGFHHAGSMKTVVENDRVIKEIEPIEMLRLLTTKSVEYIESRAQEAQRGNPFFLYVPLNSPHGPIVPSEAWQGKSGAGKHGDFVMETDWATGEIIKALEENKVINNTLVIFSSDNGTSPNANFKELNSNGHFPSAYLRGHKADIWDGGHRVPFIVRWAGTVKAGAKNDQLVCHTDFIATCADILGVELPDNASEDGISFLPDLIGQINPNKRDAIVHHSIRGNFAIRKGKWKLNLCYGSGGWSQPKEDKAKKLGMPKYQLYDMENDVGENNNLNHLHPEKVDSLNELLITYIENGRSTPGNKQQNDAIIEVEK